MSVEVPTLASLQAQGKKAAVVFWLGCAGGLTIEQKNYQGVYSNPKPYPNFICGIGYGEVVPVILQKSRQ